MSAPGALALPGAPLPGLGARPGPAASRGRAALAAGSLALLVAGGVAVAGCAATTHGFLDPAAQRGARTWIAGPLRVLDLHGGFGAAATALALMWLGYAGVLAWASDTRARWVLAAIVALHAAFLLAPPVLSTDVFAYVDYARLAAVHGLDPYAAVPASAPHDAIYAWVHWRHTHPVYGPLFVLATLPLGHVAPAVALWAFKGVAAAAGLGCAALVWRLARALGRDPARAVATFALNPILLVWTVGGAHNDLLMLLALLAGAALVGARREGAGGAAVAAAVAIKASAGLALPFVVLGAGRRGRVVAGAAGAAVAVAVLAVLAFPGHAAVPLEVLRHEQRLVAFDSVPAELARHAGLPGVTPSVRLGCEAVLAVALAWCAGAVLRGADWLAACGWAFVALLATASWLLAWYTLWPLAFAALSRDRRLLAATLLLQVLFVVDDLSRYAR